MVTKPFSWFEKNQIVIYNDCELPCQDTAMKLKRQIYQLMFSVKIKSKQEIIIKKGSVWFLCLMAYQPLLVI